MLDWRNDVPGHEPTVVAGGFVARSLGHAVTANLALQLCSDAGRTRVPGAGAQFISLATASSPTLRPNAVPTSVELR